MTIKAKWCLKVFKNSSSKKIRTIIFQAENLWFLFSSKFWTAFVSVAAKLAILLLDIFEKSVYSTISRLTKKWRRIKMLKYLEIYIDLISIQNISFKNIFNVFKTSVLLVLEIVWALKLCNDGFCLTNKIVKEDSM